MTDNSFVPDTERANGNSPSVLSSAGGLSAAGADGRRGFLKTTSTWSMAGGLVAGYGTFVILAGRFAYPSRTPPVAWQFVCRLDDMTVGDAVNFTAPDGAQIVVARLSEGQTSRDFIALSSVCPHLGCHVHWEVANDRFFCPCHNGAFDAEGRPTAGPPSQDGRALAQYPLEVQNGLLFIEVSTERLNHTRTAAADIHARGA